MSQIFVTGDSFKNYLVAIIVPKKEPLTNLAKVKGKYRRSLLLGIQGSYAELCDKPDLKLEILKDLQRVALETKVIYFINYDSALSLK